MFFSPRFDLPVGAVVQCMRIEADYDETMCKYCEKMKEMEGDAQIAQTVKVFFL